MKGRGSLHVSELMQVSTYQRDHLDHQGRHGLMSVKLPNWMCLLITRGGKTKMLQVCHVMKHDKIVTLTTISFFSRAFPSGNFSPKHMLMVYSGDPPWFSLNCLSSEQRYKWTCYTVHASLKLLPPVVLLLIC